MKKLIVAAAFFALGSATGFAADLPARTYTKAPSPVAVGYDWSGFYIGAHVGGGWGQTDVVDNNLIALIVGVPQTQRVKPSGIFGGGQIGYNYQIGKFVLGTEYTISASDIKGTTTTGLTGLGTGGTAARTDRIDYFGTAMTRFGFTPWDRVMIYDKAGVAFGHFKFNDMVSAGSYVSNTTENRVGWAVGTGIEWAFLNNWSAKLEYNYMDFGRRTVALAPVGPFPIALDIDRRVSTVDVGLNYKF